jgi:hypothetical protein
MTIAAETADFHEQTRQGRRVLSYSQISTWMACRHRWFLQYYLGLRRREPSYSLTLGDVVHRSLAGYLSGQELDYRAACDRWVSEALEGLPEGLRDETAISTFEDVRSLAGGLVERALSVIESQNWETLLVGDRPGVELELMAPLEGFDGFAGHLDWLAIERHTGRVWLVDFKVRGRFSSPSYEQLNLQHSVYHHLCGMHGIRVDGTVTFEIRADLPSRPRLNKDGTMSRAATATDWFTYRAALVDAGLDPEDYADMREKLESTRFYQLLQEWRPAETSARVWERIVLPASREIAAARAHLDEGTIPPFLWRSAGSWNCSSCSVQTVCFGAIQGYDVRPLLWGFDVPQERIDRAVEAGLLEY